MPMRSLRQWKGKKEMLDIYIYIFKEIFKRLHTQQSELVLFSTYIHTETNQGGSYKRVKTITSSACISTCTCILLFLFRFLLLRFVKHTAAPRGYCRVILFHPSTSTSSTIYITPHTTTTDASRN